MSVSVKAILGILSAAALGTWFQSRRRRQQLSSAVPDVELTTVPELPSPHDIDDDTAADIIKRAKPAMERAARVSALPER